MADLYQVLGLNREADSTQIRMAYKRLAMQYHPDRNPGNPQAEEIFKVINEAYHVLSDPLKKARYDSRLNSYETTVVYNEVVWREMQRRRYARWQQAQKKRYAFDRNYFKIQGLAFLTFLIMSGICFSIIHTANYIISLKREEVRQQKRMLVMEVNALFGSGKIDEAISRITALHKQEPLDLQFSNARDSLVEELRELAGKEFAARHFNDALGLLQSLNKYEFPHRAETLHKISICQYNLGNYPGALQSLKQLLHQQPWNIELVYQIAVINQKYLDNPEEALVYFNLGKKLFKENLTEIYGAAFEVVMNPNDAPEIYFEIFMAKANANLALKNYKEAIKDLNWAIFLRPTNAEAYKLRALAKVQTNERVLLCDDLQNAKKLGADGVKKLQRQFCR
jgi:curved DNA-binding protein CbpA